MRVILGINFLGTERALNFAWKQREKIKAEKNDHDDQAHVQNAKHV